MTKVRWARASARCSGTFQPDEIILLGCKAMERMSSAPFWPAGAPGSMQT